MTAQQNLNRKIATQSVAGLVEMARKLFNDTRDESGVVLSAVLDNLMVRMDEDSFVALCAELEG